MERTKTYKNGLKNGYRKTHYVYFASCVYKGKKLTKIGAYNGKYSIKNALNSRYKMRFSILGVFPNEPPFSEQDLHIKFKDLNFPLKYCNGVSSEFFLYTQELLETIIRLHLNSKDK